MTDTHRECEQYVFAAIAKVGRSKNFVPLRIYESPLEGKQGTLFMIETPEGEERGMFHSTKSGGDAMKDMRINVRGVKFRSIRREHIFERAGPRMSLS